MTLCLGNGYKSDGVAPGSRRWSRQKAQPPDRQDGKEGPGLQTQENSDFSLWFFTPQCTAPGAPPEGGKKAIPTPPHTEDPSARTQLGAGAGGVCETHCPDSTKRSPLRHARLPACGPPCLVPAPPGLQGTLQVTNQACFTP